LSIQHHLRQQPSFQFVILTLLMLASMLSYYVWHEHQEHHAHRQKLAQQAVRSGAREITLQLRNFHANLALFVQQEGTLLAEVAETHANDQQHQRLHKRLQLQFPDMESFLLTNSAGKPLSGNSDGLLDDQHTYTLKQFTLGRQQPILLLQDGDRYNFEIMVPWHRSGAGSGVLTVRFLCRPICRIINNEQLTDYQLQLLPPASPLEAGNGGAPDPVPALHSTIPDIGWRIVAQPRPDLTPLDRSAGQALLLFMFSSILSLLLYRRWMILERQRSHTEQRYRNLLETSEDLIWSIDRKGYLTQINDSAWPILGLNAEEMIGRPLLEFVPDDELQNQFKALRNLLSGHAWKNHITRLASSDGRDIHMRFNALPIFSPKGEIEGATGTATNITEQINALDVLREKEQRYRQMFETNQAIKLILDATCGDIIEANSAASRFYGYPEETLRSLGFHDLNQAEPLRLGQLLGAIRQGQLTTFQETHRLASGREREVEIQAGPVTTGDTELIYLIINDVTEREQSLKALRDNEQKLQSLVEAATEGIAMLDDDGLVQLFNPAAEMMFGRLEEDLIGVGFEQLFEASAPPGEQHALAWYLANWGFSEDGGIRELIGYRSNGDEFPLRLSLSPFELDQRPHYLLLMQDLSESREAEQRLAYLAQHDVLTGLLNRAELERRLAVLLSTPASPRPHHVVCFMDIDQFKLVNDTGGHDAGDELLRQLAILIKSQLKGFDLLGRVGGDEFGVILTDCSVERAESISSNLLQTIRSFFFSWQERSYDVAVSIGLFGFKPGDESTSSILSSANVACQMAKEQGRNRLHIYHTGDTALVRHHGDMHLVAGINQALQEGRFHLYVQPIVPVNGADERHYEVLVRMIDEAGDTVVPDHFIPAAERYILMPAIDRWIISELFTTQGETLRQWAEVNQQTGEFLFAINLSGTSLSDDGFLNYLERLFDEWRIPFRSICFEITETAAVANLEHVKVMIKRLKSFGCRFALDDFGTGLSSYSYLKELPVDYLKIDGSFVRNMATDPVDYAMVESINQIGHILGLETIAEWAEDQTILNQLRVLNVDYAQGYGVGEPMPLKEFRL